MEEFYVENVIKMMYNKYTSNSNRKIAIRKAPAESGEIYIRRAPALSGETYIRKTLALSREI